MIMPLVLQSVSFSGPGTQYSKWQFGTKIGEDYLYPRLSRAADQSTVFMPSHDFVPTVDSHVGNVQDTICSRKGFLSCHGIGVMTCDLLLRCGDGHDKKRFHSCEGAFRLIFDENKLEEFV